VKGKKTDAFTVFRSSVREYCELIEKHRSTPKREFLSRLHILLPLLISRAAELPEVEPVSEHPVCGRSQTEDWRRLYKSLSRKLGALDLYYDVYDPRVDDEKLTHTLADDLADI
jgi:hypothetical protein